MVYGSRPMNSEMEKLVEVGAKALFCQWQLKTLHESERDWNLIDKSAQDSWYELSSAHLRAILPLVLTPSDIAILAGDEEDQTGKPPNAGHPANDSHCACCFRRPSPRDHGRAE